MLVFTWPTDNPVGTQRIHGPTGYIEEYIADQKGYTATTFADAWDAEYNTLHLYLNWETGSDVSWITPLWFQSALGGHQFHYVRLNVEITAETPTGTQTLNIQDFGTGTGSGIGFDNYPQSGQTNLGFAVDAYMLRERSGIDRGYINLTMPCSVTTGTAINAGHFISIAITIWDPYPKHTQHLSLIHI